MNVIGTRRRLLPLLAVLLLAMCALVGVGGGAAHATNLETADGEVSQTCSIDWRAAATAYPGLTNDTKVEYDGKTYTNLMQNPSGGAVDGWVNGGFLQEVTDSKSHNGDWMELNHWGGDPTSDPARKALYWRTPIAFGSPVRDTALTQILPAGTQVTRVFTVTYDLFDARAKKPDAVWPGEPYHSYSWHNPSAEFTDGGAGKDGNIRNTRVRTLADGRVEVTVPIGAMEARSGVGISIDTTVPNANLESPQNISTAHLAGFRPAGTGPKVGDDYLCPPIEDGNNSNSDECTIDWKADGYYTVPSAISSISDVSRDFAVSPAMAELGKFGVDGWGGPDATQGSLFGRFVYTTDVPVTSAQLVVHIDGDVTTDASKFTTHSPIPENLQWRVDKAYAEGMTVSAGEWNEASHTMTYTVSGPARSGLIIEWNGTVPLTSWVPGKVFTNTMTLGGTYERDPGNKYCFPTPYLQLDKAVTDASGDGVAQAGEALKYTFTATNTGNVPLHHVVVTEGEFTGTGTLSAVTCPATVLEVGASMTCTADYTVTQTDVDNEHELSNVATATGTSPHGTRVQGGPARASIRVPAPEVALDKTVADTGLGMDGKPVTGVRSDHIAQSGEKLIYSFTVQNTGQTRLDDVTIDDARLNLTGYKCALHLEPGEEQTCTVAYEATAADVAAGSIQNTARAGAVVAGSKRPIVSGQSSAIIPAVDIATLTSTSVVPSTATTVVTTTKVETVTSQVPTTITTTKDGVPTTVTTVVPTTITSQVPTTLTSTVTSFVPVVVPSTVTSLVPTTITTTKDGVPTTITTTVTDTRTVSVSATTATATTSPCACGSGSIGGLGSLGGTTVPTGSGSGSSGSGSLGSGSSGGSAGLGDLLGRLVGLGSLQGIGSGSLGSGSSALGTGSTGSGSTGLGTGSLDAGSLGAGAGSSTGSIAGGLAVGSLALGSLALGDSVAKGRIPLQVPEIGSLVGVVAPPVAPPAPAPGPGTDNGRGAEPGTVDGVRMSGVAATTGQAAAAAAVDTGDGGTGGAVMRQVDTTGATGGTAAASPARTALASTGVQVGLVAALAGICLAVGAVLVIRRRA